MEFLLHPLQKLAGARLNVKLPSYQYRDPHVNMGIPYLEKTVFILKRGPDIYGLYSLSRTKT